MISYKEVLTNLINNYSVMRVTIINPSVNKTQVIAKLDIMMDHLKLEMARVKEQ